MDYKKTIAANLKAARKEKKIGQREIADHLNVSVSAVSMWERADNSMNADTFLEICDFLKVSPGTIAGHIPDGVTPSEMDMIRMYRALDDRGKATVIDTIRRESGYIKNNGNAAASA